MSSKTSTLGLVSEHPGRAAVFLQPWDNKSRNDHIEQSEQEGNILNGTIWLSWEAVMAARQALMAPGFSGCRSQTGSQPLGK